VKLAGLLRSEGRAVLNVTPVGVAELSGYNISSFLPSPPRRGRRTENELLNAKSSGKADIIN